MSEHKHIATDNPNYSIDAWECECGYRTVVGRLFESHLKDPLNTVSEYPATDNNIKDRLYKVRKHVYDTVKPDTTTIADNAEILVEAIQLDTYSLGQQDENKRVIDEIESNLFKNIRADVKMENTYYTISEREFVNFLTQLRTKK